MSRVEWEKTYNSHLAVIRKWKMHWMIKEPGYKERGFGIDSNMMHNLAKLLTEASITGGSGNKTEAPND